MGNCVNCGAPLNSNKCQYCGTEHDGNIVKAKFLEKGTCGELNICGNTYQVYLGEVETQSILADCYRDVDGNLHRSEPIRKHKFTLIEF